MRGERREFQNIHEEKESPEKNIEKDLGEFLQSKEFFEMLYTCPDETRDEIIGMSIEYFLLDDNKEHILRFLQDVILFVKEKAKKQPGISIRLSHDRIPFILKHLIANNHFDITSDRGKEQVFLYIKEHIEKNEYFYHGFNGAFQESIRKQGLQPHVRSWNWEEISTIDEILSGVGLSMGLGWAKINSESKISLGDEPANTYRYAVASPEWFAQFVSDGLHIPLTPPYDKKAYYTKNHAAARKNIELLCDRLMTQSTPEQIENFTGYKNMTKEEKERVLTFFEHCWEKFCGDSGVPMVALIKKDVIFQFTKDLFSSYKELVAFSKKHSIFSKETDPLKDYLELLLASHHHNLQITHGIAAKDITFVELPPYEKVHN